MLTRPDLGTGDDRGSIPMALLGIIVVSAIVGVVTATVFAGERQTRFDTAYEASLQTAELGVGEFMSIIKNDLLETNTVACPTGPITPYVEARCIPETEVDAGEYTVRGERDDGDNWRILGVATAGGVQRRVQVLLELQQPFRHALFGDRSVTFTGAARQARSFDSIAQTWDTGNATLATNSSSINQDSAVVYDNKPGTADADIDVASDDAVAFITDALLTCADDDALETGKTVLSDEELEPQTRCVEHLEFDGDVVLDDSATQDDPVRIFVTGNMVFGRNSRVNCGEGNAYAKCQWGSSPPDFPQPGALQIYSIGEGQVRLEKGAHVSAAIYAPRAHCFSQPHANVFGALVCRAAGSFTGHFRLYYDDALKNIYGPERRIWSEEPGGLM